MPMIRQEETQVKQLGKIYRFDMLVEIDRKDVIRLIRGTSPSYEKMGIFVNAGLGYYVGGFSDRWEWEHDWSDKLDSYSSKELYDLYKYNLKQDADSFIDTFIQAMHERVVIDEDDNRDKSISDPDNG